MFYSNKIELDFAQLAGQMAAPYPENRYAVVEGGCYVFSERFASWSEAMDFAEGQAKQYPGDRYEIIYIDTRVVAERPEPVVKAISHF